VVLSYNPTALADSFIPQKKLGEKQLLFPLDLTLCCNCGYTHIPDVVDPGYLYRDYVYVTTSSVGLVNHFRNYAEQMFVDLGLKEGGLAVDIGSNDGTLLRFFQEKGMKVLGVEPALEIARDATNAGIETLPDFFSLDEAKKIRQKYGGASLITANNIYANIDNLRDFTLGVRHLLLPDGVFVIECSYLGDMIENSVFDYVYHEHLSYFSIKPLDIFFRSLSMELIDIMRVPTKGGSIRLTVKLKDGQRKRKAIVEEFLQREKRIGLDSEKIFMDLHNKIVGLKSEVNRVLSNLQAQGGKIAGYGASATTTTLIYQLELARYIDFIVDDNPAKHNTYSPGYHIPVCPSEELYKKDLSAVLILAWRFAEIIMKRHERFLKNGGKFIIPVPEVRIL
jgi:hypothetical protein